MVHMKKHHNKLEDSRREGDFCGRHHQDPVRLNQDRRVTHHHLEAQEELPWGGPPPPPQRHAIWKEEKSSQELEPPQEVHLELGTFRICFETDNYEQWDVSQYVWKCIRTEAEPQILKIIHKEIIHKAYLWT